MKNHILAYSAKIGRCYLVVAPAFAISIILSLYEIRYEVQILIVTTKFQIITPDHEDKPNINAYRITKNISMFLSVTRLYRVRICGYILKRACTLVAILLHASPYRSEKPVLKTNCLINF